VCGAPALRPPCPSSSLRLVLEKGIGARSHRANGSRAGSVPPSIDSGHERQVYNAQRVDRVPGTGLGGIGSCRIDAESCRPDTWSVPSGGRPPERPQRAPEGSQPSRRRLRPPTSGKISLREPGATGRRPLSRASTSWYSVRSSRLFATTRDSSSAPEASDGSNARSRREARPEDEPDRLRPRTLTVHVPPEAPRMVTSGAEEEGETSEAEVSSRARAGAGVPSGAVGPRARAGVGRGLDRLSGGPLLIALLGGRRSCLPTLGPPPSRLKVSRRDTLPPTRSSR